MMNHSAFSARTTNGTTANQKLFANDYMAKDRTQRTPETPKYKPLSLHKLRGHENAWTKQAPASMWEPKHESFGIHDAASMVKPQPRFRAFGSTIKSLDETTTEKLPSFFAETSFDEYLPADGVIRCIPPSNRFDPFACQQSPDEYFCPESNESPVHEQFLSFVDSLIDGLPLFLEIAVAFVPLMLEALVAFSVVYSGEFLSSAKSGLMSLLMGGLCILNCVTASLNQGMEHLNRNVENLNRWAHDVTKVSATQPVTKEASTVASSAKPAVEAKPYGNQARVVRKHAPLRKQREPTIIHLNKGSTYTWHWDVERYEQELARYKINERATIIRPPWMNTPLPRKFLSPPRKPTLHFVNEPLMFDSRRGILRK